MGRSNYSASSGAEAGPAEAAEDSAAETATGPSVAVAAVRFGAVVRAVVAVVSHGGSGSDAVGGVVHSPAGGQRFVGCLVDCATAPVGAPAIDAAVDCAIAPVGAPAIDAAVDYCAIAPVGAPAIDAAVDCAIAPVDAPAIDAAVDYCAIAPLGAPEPVAPEIAAVPVVAAELSGPPLDAAALHLAADSHVLIFAVVAAVVESDALGTQLPSAARGELHVAPVFALVFALGPAGHAERWQQ